MSLSNLFYRVRMENISSVYNFGVYPELPARDLELLLRRKYLLQRDA